MAATTEKTSNEQQQQKLPKCANPECDKESGKLICPNCKDAKKTLNVSSFCSQECFKTFWPIHKLTHNFPKAQQAGEDQGKAAAAENGSSKKKSAKA